MKIAVRFDSKCAGDTQPRSDEELALIRLYIETLIDSFGEHGQLEGAILIHENNWVWRDDNWKLHYSIVDSASRRIITINRIELNWPR